MTPLRQPRADPPMGIVAYCPNRHRVKVKDHLAGKKGICPDCGAGFRIPNAAADRPAPSPQPAPAGTGQSGRPVARFVSLDARRAASLPRALPLARPGSENA